HEVRRQNRLLQGARVDEIIENGENGFLSLGLQDKGYAFGIPLNYVKSDNSIYFHCAIEGVKLEMIKLNPKVSFCIVGITKPLPSVFSTIYESVIIFGNIQIITDIEAKMNALKLIIKKYSPDYMDDGIKYSSKSEPRTTILRLDIEHVTAKARQE
ncbi:MAG: pyridoxamine 5'-phosphate oxidase family protein, partial [Deferribacteraceae bacterium]|nr:pyridoxamine 5'-phosphate oxidase family protein [Deferribacteraceae bacterium]